MKTPNLPFVLPLLFLLSGSSFAETRTWTQAATGKTITGELQRVEGKRSAFSGMAVP